MFASAAISIKDALIITTVGQVDFAVQNVTNLETLKNYDFMIGFNRIFT